MSYLLKCHYGQARAASGYIIMRTGAGKRLMVMAIRFGLFGIILRFDKFVLLFRCACEVEWNGSSIFFSCVGFNGGG